MVGGKFGPHSDLVQAFLDEVASIDRGVWHPVAEMTDVFTTDYQPSVVGFGFNAAIHSALDSAAIRAYRQLKLGPNEFTEEEMTQSTGAARHNIAGALARVVFTVARWDEVLLASRREVMMPFVKVGFTTLVPLVAEEEPADDIAARESYREGHPLGWRRYGQNGQAVEAYIQEIATVSHDDMRRLRSIVNANLVGRGVLRRIRTWSLPLWKERAVDRDVEAAFDGLGVVFEEPFEYSSRRDFARTAIRNGGRVLAVAADLSVEDRRAALEPFAALGMTSVLGTMLDESPPVDSKYPGNDDLVTGFVRQVPRIAHEEWHRLYAATPRTAELMAAHDAVDLPLLHMGRQSMVYAGVVRALKQARREDCCQEIWPRISARVHSAAHLLTVYQHVPMEHRHIVLDPFQAAGFTAVSPVVRQ